jgi:hypothetical protein
MPAITPGLSSWLALSLLTLPLLEVSYASSRVPLPTPAHPPLQRGQVYLRIQGAGASELRHYHIPAAIRFLGGGMLDHPGQVTRPLLIEHLDDRGRQWVMLERQLALRTSRQGNGLANIQTLQVLDGRPLPAGGQLLFSAANGVVACTFNGKAEADLVAFRLVGERDHQIPRFTDLQLAWRVNRGQLRLEPIDPSGVSCANPAEGQP